VTTPPRAVVLITGSELVRGDLRDANGAFLAAELTRIGVEPGQIVVVGDRPEALAAAVRIGLEADICVISGGLGPTHDDRTVEILAEATGRRLTVDEDLAREIEGFSRGVAERLGRPYADFAAGVRKQAALPAGAVSLGLAGTAPAVLLEHDGRVAVALPGPPNELRRLWPRALEHRAFRELAARARPRSHRLVRLFGPSESAVARALAEAGGEARGVEATVCAHDLEIRVDLFADRGAEKGAAALEDALRERFGEELFAVDDDREVAELVLDLCRERGLKLATAESCTGGLVGARITAVPGSSDVYLGGAVAYANEVKTAWLGVPQEVLTRHGAVSAETAKAMAAGARRRLGSDIGLADTGIAGPGGGTADKPVGLVFLHAESPDGDSAAKLQLPGDREAVRTRATAAALHLLRRQLTQSRDPRV
jgi:nicotinamide-nucleotide amidase